MATACDATTSVRQPLRAFQGAAYLHRTRTSSRNHRASYRIKPTGELSRTRLHTEPRHPTATTNRGSSGELAPPGQHGGGAPGEGGRRPPSILSQHGRPPSHYPTLRSGSNG